jgi:predicted ATPase
MNRSSPRAYIEELRLSGFRAFENARLRLDDLTVLVGHNGSGKSTLLDALEFVRDALSDSMENALDRRGGLQALQHRSARSSDISIAVGLRLPEHSWFRHGTLGPRAGATMAFVEDAPAPPKIGVTYGFRLGPKRGGLGFAVKDERVRFSGTGISFGGLELPEELLSKPSPTLLLPVVGDVHPYFRLVLESLRAGIRTYNLSAAAIRAEPPVGRASTLTGNGDNAGDVLHHLQRNKKDLDWVVRHLSAITPAITSLKASTAAGRRLIQFIQRRDKNSLSRFNIGDMSDGTLRCMAILLALRQTPTPTLTCIEEIEDSVHPAALGVLLDAISASTERGQVLITSHSPEALSHPVVTPERVRIIEWRNGRSHIFLPSQGSHEMSKPPRSVGTLLRTNALFPAKAPEQIEGDIFESP